MVFSFHERSEDHNDGSEAYQDQMGVLELAKQLGNVSKACQLMMGDSRDSFYRFKRLDDTGREAALQLLRSNREPPVQA